MVLLITGCAGSGGTDTPAHSRVSQAASSITTVASSTRSTAAEGPIEVTFAETGGGLGAGESRTSLRLRPDATHRFGRFVPPFTVTPTVEHWEVKTYRRDSVRLRWRGESGFRPGTLVVALFGLADATVDETWEQLEVRGQEELDAVGETWTWTDRGTGLVGELPVEWREMRTTENKPLDIASAPCVVDLPGDECVWFESTARFYVVPLADLTVTILATEQMCDCDLGALLVGTYGDNELHDWLPVLEALLESVRFET